jgi:hypothetical protein
MVTVVGLAVRIGAGGTMVIERLAVADMGGASESVTATPNVSEPVWVGVPEISPEEVFSVRPGGRFPDVMLQE